MRHMASIAVNGLILELGFVKAGIYSRARAHDPTDPVLTGPHSATCVRRSIYSNRAVSTIL